MNAYEILIDVQARFGLPTLALAHMKKDELEAWKGTADYYIIPALDLKGKAKAKQVFLDPSVLVIYESTTLGLFVIVAKHIDEPEGPETQAPAEAAEIPPEDHTPAEA